MTLILQKSVFSKKANLASLLCSSLIAPEININTKMVKDIKVNGKKGCNMEKKLMIIQVGIDILEDGRKINMTALEYIHMSMVQDMSDSIKMEKMTGKEHIHILMVQNIKDNG